MINLLQGQHLTVTRANRDGIAYVRIAPPADGRPPLELSGAEWLELCEFVAAIEAAVRFTDG